jgi:hypothetical protein
MTRDVADKITAGLEAAGFDYTRIVDSNGHRIELARRELAGPDILALLEVLLPGGAPIPNAVVSWQSGKLTVA